MAEITEQQQAELEAQVAGVTLDEEIEGEGTEEQNAELDAEADGLLEQLAESQAEVTRMLEQQAAQTAELGTMKEAMTAELLELQDEAWKLNVYAELEMLKRQLAAITALDNDLANMETQLDTLDEEATEVEGEELVAGATAALEGGEDDGGDDLADVSAMQQELDDELAAMYKQLESVKAEAAAVSARKAALEAELYTLLHDGFEGEGGLGEGDDTTLRAADKALSSPAPVEAS